MNKAYNFGKWIFFVAIVSVFLISCGEANTKKKVATKVDKIEDTSEPINDRELLKHFASEAGKLFTEIGGSSAGDYQKNLSNKKCEVNLEPFAFDVMKGGAFYSTFKKRVFVMGMLTKPEGSSDYQIGTSSAFPISSGGVCVTNYHVFKSYNPAKPHEYESMFVMDFEGKVYPVIEVLAASKKDDLAIFRIKCEDGDIEPLALGYDQPAGEELNLISHPDDRFFYYSRGYLNRKYIKPGTSKVRQCMSAEFAKGSSGSPIMDQYGNVVGVVAGTQNIHYLPQVASYQMTIREIIPVSRIKALIQ